MKWIPFVALISLLCFLSGLGMNYFGKAQAPESANQNSQAPPAPTPTPCPQVDEFPKLIDDRYVTRFSGSRLSLEYTSGVQSEDVPFAVDGAEVAPLDDGGVLVMFGDTLYRLNRQYQTIWRYHTAQVMFDFAYVQSTDLIYGTAGDNVMFIIDAGTGKERHTESRNGSAAYGVAKKYGDEMCLVTDNFVMYREKFRGDRLDQMKDGITCWQGTRVLWHRDFPPDADLVVNGMRILAVTKSKNAIYVKEIIPPKIKSE